LAESEALTNPTNESDSQLEMDSVDRSARPLVDFGLPAAILAVLTAIFFLLPIDLAVGDWFHNSEDGWFLKDAEPLQFVYKKGLIPALCVAGGSALVLLVGFKSEWLRKYRKVAIYLLLVMVIGPGLIVNALMKEGWGRPRPRQVEEFGGKDRYERLWEYDGASYGKSFPSGHASMGFYFFCVYFLWRREGRKSVLLGLSLALGLGALLGFTRVAQGGHFVSDVIWSAGVCYFVAAGLYYAMGLHRSLGFAGGRMSRGAIVGCLVGMLGVGLLAVGTPYHEEKNYPADAVNLSKAERVKLKLELPRANLHLQTGGGFSVKAEAEGFGSPGSRIEDRFEQSFDLAMGELRMELRQSKHGFFATVEQPMSVNVPSKIPLDADVVLEKGVLSISLFDSTVDYFSENAASAFWDLELGDVDVTIYVPDFLQLKVEIVEGVEFEVENDVPELEWDGQKRRWKRGDEPTTKIRIKSLNGGKIRLRPALKG